jgi:RNA polymerase-binding transcription factor DksA
MADGRAVRRGRSACGADDAWAARRIGAAYQATMARITALTTEQEAIRSDAVDAIGDDEHDPEGATIAFERARVAALLELAVAQLAALDEAVARIAVGALAVCARCGAQIAPERLAALPAATTCVACARERSDSPLARRFPRPPSTQ